MHKIKDLRISLGLTQKEFGKRIDLDAHNIGDWERGKGEPSTEWLCKIAKEFNISVDYLLGLEDDFGVKSFSAPTVSALTEDEKELLELYKQLPPERKKMLIYSAQDSLTAWRSKFGAGNVSRK